jgi:hypothetical protein
MHRESDSNVANSFCGPSFAADAAQIRLLFQNKKREIGCHDLGVLDKVVFVRSSHGLTADGKTVAFHFEQGDGPATQPMAT